MMSTEQVIKSTQEQAVASWAGYLNQIRIENLFGLLDKQDCNMQKAMNAIKDAQKDIRKLILTNRGSYKGVHGFIAEVAEVGIGNAKENIQGNENIYEWLNNNGPSDLERGTTLIQQKFVNSGGTFSLGAVAKHLKKYPDYLKSGEKYQIPKDHYESIKYLLSLSKDDAGKLTKSGDGYTYSQWQNVHEFFDNNPNVSIKNIEPSLFEYKDVQVGTIDRTIKREKAYIKETDRQRRDNAIENSKANLKEAGKATAVSAIIEGGTAFITSVVKRIKNGKSLKDFTQDDWEAIIKETGIGTFKGGIRGASIYGVTTAIVAKAPEFYNVGISKEAVATYNKTASATANAIVTASFGFAGLINKFRKNEISEQKLLEDSQIVCLDASISALSSIIGQMIIPIPVFGAIIGNAVGTMLYETAKTNFNAKEQAIMKQYYDEIIALDNKLDEQYRQFAADIQSTFESFLYIVSNAFSPDLETAFEGSVELAKICGVADDEILDTVEKGRSYFLD